MNSNSLLSALRNRKKEAGFTLIEVLIAMAVLVFISFGIYQATTETYRLRDILLNEGDFYNGIRLAMDILQKDISQIYSPSLMAPQPSKSPSPAAGGGFGTPPSMPIPQANVPLDRDTQTILSGDLGQTTRFWLPATDKTGIRNSHFIGTDSKLSFVASTHLRIYRDTPESEFSKITYELVRDTENKENPDAMVLVKTENADAFSGEDAKDEPFTRTFKLLKGITKFRFRYFKRDGNTWKEVSSWDNEKEDQKNTFPDVIELALTVNGPLHMTFDGRYKFRPEAPLRGLNPSF